MSTLAADYIEQWEKWAYGDDCLHSGHHCKPNKCLDCGRFSSHSWTTGWIAGPDGSWEAWGGTCKVHGEWQEST